MEFLTKRLQQAQEEGSVQGIQLVPSSPTLTHALYADDLVLFGEARAEEVQGFNGILREFGDMSGLRVNPEKSTIWFSRACSEGNKEEVLEALQAKVAGGKEKYLGIYMTKQTRGLDPTHELLEEKFWEKFTGWKMHLLSPAGRVTLIRSVLTSVPVYYMSVMPLPVKTTTKLTSLLRKFLWGKLGKERYLAMVSWDKICQGKEIGGLELRDLKLMNDALLLKLTWQLAKGVDKPWVHVMKAKYCEHGNIWKARMGPGVSCLWRKMGMLRDKLQADVTWVLGTGSSVQVEHQPWFPGWELHTRQAEQLRDMTVAQLVTEDRGWNNTELVSIFGQELAQVVTSTIPVPDVQSLLPDRLIWKHANNGQYQVKLGYQLLAEEARDTWEGQVNPIWMAIWKMKRVMPKVKLFLWKACHDALPTASAVHRRIQRIPPLCGRCQRENEYTMHMLFFCPGSRATWFASHLPVRVEELPLDFIQTLTHLGRIMHEDQHAKVANLMWCIWKARNIEIIEGRRMNPIGVIQQARAMDTETPLPTSQATLQNIPYQIPMNWGLVKVDGSWEQSHKAGWAFVVYDPKDALVTLSCGSIQVEDPFQAEANGVLEAVRWVQDHGHEHQWQGVHIVSDSANLVKAVRNQDLSEFPYWRAAGTILKAKEGQQTSATLIKIGHVNRIGVQEAHTLANWIRRKGGTHTGREIPEVAGLAAEIEQGPGVNYVREPD